MSLKQQAAFNTVGNIVYLFALWLLTVITTRVLGYKSVGILTLSMAMANVISTFQVFGMRGYQSSDYNNSYSSWEYVMARIVTVVIGIFIDIIVCIALGYDSKVRSSIILYCMLKTSETFSDVLFGNDQRVGHLEYAGYSMAARGVVIICLFTFTALVSRNLNRALFTASFGALVLSIFIDLPAHNKIVEAKTIVSINRVFDILKVCFPLLISTLIPAAIAAFPRVILERYFGATILGFYGNVSTPALLLTTIIPTILLALLPIYGKRFGHKDFRGILKIWICSIIGVIFITVIAVLGTLVLGKPVLTLVYTDNIVPFIPYLYFVLLSMMAYAITMCNNTLLVAIRKNWSLTMTSVIALLLCVLTSVFLIPIWGINGAIASLAIPYTLQALIQAFMIVAICKNGDKV